MSTQTNPTNNIREAVTALIRYRWRFVLPAFVVTAGIFSVALMVPRKYQADAVFERRVDPVLSEMNSKGASQIQNPRGTIVQELSGELAVEKLIKQIKAESAGKPDSRGIAQGVNDLRHEVSKSVVVRYDMSNNELDRITVSYISANPDMARLVVNRLVENYIQQTRQAMEQRLTQSASFFENEVIRERGIIEDLENKLLQFEIAHAELLPDNPTSLQMTLTDAQARLAEMEQNLKALATREETIGQTLRETPAVTPSVTHGPNPEVTRLEGELRRAEATLAEAVNVLKMKDKHPDLIAMRDRVSAIKTEISAAEPEVVIQRQLSDNPRRSELEMTLANAVAERQSLEAQIAATQKRVTELEAQTAGLFPIRSDYRKITRELDQHQRQLGFWEDNLRRVRMAVTAENGNRGIQLDFIKPCAALNRPVSPNLTQVILAAIGIGLMAGVASVFFAHRGDETFASGEELAKNFQIPLMGSVSEIISRKQRQLRTVRNFIVYPLNAVAMLTVLAVLAGVLYLELERPEDYAKLRRAPGRMFFNQPDAPVAATAMLTTEKGE